MDHDDEAVMSMSEPRPTVVSPHVPSQLNETIYGCRCGCGCGCAGRGDGHDCDRVSNCPTAVNSDSSDDGHDNRLDDDVAGQAIDTILSPHGLSHQRIALLLERAENLQLGTPLVGGEQLSARPQLHDDCEVLSESLFNEAPNTEDYSDAVSDRRSVQMVSPGPGIGAWLIAERTWVQEVELVYFFNARPLRLSAEYQHARGKAVEHLLVPDEVSFADVEG